MNPASNAPDHPANPKTHESSARYFLKSGNKHLLDAARRDGDRHEVSLRCASGAYALACENAEEAAYCRGDRLGFDFCLLSGAEPYAVGGVLAPYGSTNMRPGYVTKIRVAS